MGQTGVFGEASGRPMPVAVENFAALQARQRGDDPTGNGDLGGRVNLLNWDGRGSPRGLFPADGNRGEPGTTGGTQSESGIGAGYDQAEDDGPDQQGGGR